MPNQLKEQASTLWNKTPVSKRITLIALIIAGIAMVAALIGWANTPSYSVAYAGLSDEDAAQIVAKLDELGTSYQVKDSGTILVLSDQVYKARLSMASEGLPENSTVGYELFSESTLGMTEFTQKVNYQRALEGELERTIGSLDSVETVRVHVVNPEDKLLTSEQSPTTASVIIKEKAGGSLDKSQVKAISNLVAFSVEGLKPENVVIIDANTNQLVSASGSEEETLIAQSDSQRAAEAAAEAEIQEKVQSMLDSILGPDRAAVEASVIMNWSQKEITSNIYDPTQTALISAQKVYESYSGTGEDTGGIPGASSNLPTAVATLTETDGSGNYLHTEETTNYEVSQVQTHEVYAPGQITKISLAVMVDEVTDNAQLEMIKNSVIAAAGIDTTRGDTVAVNTMAFDRTYYEDQVVSLEENEKDEQYKKIGIGVGAGLFLILLFIYFSKVMKNLQMASKAAWKPILMPVGMAAMQGAMPNSMARHIDLSDDGEIEDTEDDIPLKKEESLEMRKPSISASKAAAEDEQRARIISRLTEENPATVAEIIQIWLSEDEKNRG